MPEPAVVAMPALGRHDRWAVLASLAGVTAIAWVYLFWSAARMMGSSQPIEMAQIHSWLPSDFVLVFLMWAVMMIGMMLPTATPMTLIYAAVVRKAARDGTTLAPTATFVAGYVAMWTLFSVVATLAQWGLDRAALLSPMLVTTSPKIGAALLVAAGVYQLTPAKTACLRHCRSPAYFISEHWRAGTVGAFQMGLVHGAFCLGCCWLLMGLLFVGGVMNLLWVAAIAIFVLCEKVIPRAPLVGKLAGGAMILTGMTLLVAWMRGGG